MKEHTVHMTTHADQSHTQNELRSCYKLARRVRTRAEENDGFEVGILIRVWRQLGHAVAELLHPPDVFHH